MAKILVVDDEIKIREIIKEYAEFEGYEVAQAEDGMQAVEMVKNQDFDIIIMDVMMPKLDGYSACKEIRKIKQIPVIMLSARGEEYDKLFGFEIGVDDYVVKPFSLAILLAKTQALIRRRNGGNPAGFITCGAITLDTNRRLCLVGQEEVKISPREYDLLLCLMRNQDRVLSREQLLDKVWGLDFEGEDRAVDVRVRSLRAALGSAGSQIKTMYKAGYKLEEV